ncbi:MAG: crossover junction endodeoxyribonuclease RuvC [Chloroflexota bacterium]
MRVLGVDPGLTRTGWASVAAEGSGYRLLAASVIAPRGGENLPARLREAYDEFTGILDREQPVLVVVEDVFATPKFPAAALKMAHLRGVLCLAAAQREIEVLAMTATTVKQRLTGNGHASKDQVQHMVFRLCDVGARKLPMDLSDAIGLAIAGLHQMRSATLGMLAR